MPPVSGSVHDLYRDADSGKLAKQLAGQVGIRDQSPRNAEFRSWQRNLPVLFAVLRSAGLGHVHVVPEHRMPYSPRRVDAVICGTHPDTGKASYILIELKQWTRAHRVSTTLVRFDTDDKQPKLHPAEQVRRYCRHLVDFTPDLARRPDAVRGMAYMHWAERDHSWELDDFDFDDYGHLYTADQITDFIADLRELLDTDPRTGSLAEKAASDLLSFKPAPARTLLATAAASLENRDDFVLLDDQQVAFELIREAVAQSEEPARQKKVVIVRGGPGSGKSAIAMTLLASLARKSKKALHATGSKAFTQTLRAIVNPDGQDDDRLERMFTYFNEYGSTPANALDVLICDEAHRIRGIPEHLGPVARTKVRDQIAELINAAKVPVFLMDNHQVIRPGEIGTPRHVVTVARQKGCEVVEVDLEGQFRCGGSPRYDEWVHRLLGLSEGDPVAWSDLVAGTDDEYVVSSVNSPHALDAWLRRQTRNFSGTARIAAGYCWNWSDPVEETDGSYVIVEDIDIRGWRRPWNTKHDGKAPDDAPPAALWASDPRGFSQVGCVYTAQGFEYDWAGVIFGGDLVIRDGRWTARREYSEDPAVNGADPPVFDQLVRNTYKVLLTRGMQGTCLYSVDDETNEFLSTVTS